MKCVNKAEIWQFQWFGEGRWRGQGETGRCSRGDEAWREGGLSYSRSISWRPIVNLRY